jgi:predicted dehydrogenase
MSLLEAEKDLDAVSICTYNCAHRDCAVEAFRHGLNVLLEKPMSVTLEEAEAICRAEKESGKILCVGFQPRFDANMQNIKRIVESGQLGKIYYIQTGGGRRRGIPGSTFIEKETGGIGALGDIGCYSLDMVLNAVGYPKPLTVSGYTSDYFGKNPKYYGESERFSVDDFGAAFVRLEGGIILDFRISWAMHPDSPGDTIIFGTEGALRIPATDCWNGSVGGPMKLYFDTKSGKKTKKTVPLRSNLKKGTLWNQKIGSFLDAVKNGTASPIPSWQILINQAIIDGINRSAELGQEVKVEIPEI